MSHDATDETESALEATIVAQMGSGGDLELRLSAIRTLLSRAEARGDAERSVRMMLGEALALSDGGRTEEAEARYREARARAESVPDRSVLAKARRELGAFLSTLGRAAEAEVELAAGCALLWVVYQTRDVDPEKRSAAELAWGQAVGDLGLAYQKRGGAREASQCLRTAMQILSPTMPNWVIFGAHYAGLLIGLDACSEGTSRLMAAIAPMLSFHQGTTELNFGPGELPKLVLEHGPDAVVFVRTPGLEGVAPKQRVKRLDYLEILLKKGFDALVPALAEASGAALDEIVVEAMLSGGFRITPRVRGETPAALRQLVRFTVWALIGLADRRILDASVYDVMTTLSSVLANAGEHAAAEPLSRKLYTIALDQRGLEDALTQKYLMHLGFVLWGQHKLDEADDAFQRALPAIERTQGAGSDQAITCAFNLGAVRFARGDYRAALSICRDVLERHRRADRPESTGRPESTRGLLLLGEVQALEALGHEAEASEKAEAAIASARSEGDAVAEISLLHVACRVALAQGDLEAARARSEEALSRARSGKVRHEQASHLLRARVRSRSGDHAGAEEDCRRALALVPRCPDSESHAHVVLAEILRAAGRIAEARAAIDAALAARGERIAREDQNRLSEELAEIEAAEGRREDAARRLSEVLDFQRKACGAESAPARRIEARIAALRATS